PVAAGLRNRFANTPRRDTLIPHRPNREGSPMSKLSLPALLLLAWPGLAPAQPEAPQLLQRPAVSRTHVVFVYAGDLWIVGRDGGLPTELPLPSADEGSFSPDGKRIAYVPYSNRPSNPTAFVAWKNYRGGTASPVWIADLADSSVEPLPRDKSADFNPMW